MTELAPLPPELQALLDAERERPGPDSGTVDRLFSRVAASIDLLPPGGGHDRPKRLRGVAAQLVDARGEVEPVLRPL